jgi:hypothetical protein
LGKNFKVGKPETPYLKEMTYMIKISPIILAEMTCITLSEKSDIHQLQVSSGKPLSISNRQYPKFMFHHGNEHIGLLMTLN